MSHPDTSSRLSALFAAHVPAGLDPARAAELEDALQQALRAGQATWPMLKLPADAFMRALAERCTGKDPAALQKELAALHAADLYLICACVQGHKEALRLFDESVIRRVPMFLSHMRLPASEVEDVQQELRQKLLIASGGNSPGLVAYGGRGELGNWVRVAAVRCAIDRRRPKDEQAERDDGTLAERAAGLTADPTLESMKQRYGSAFKKALEEALSSLTSEQRNLLRLYYVDGVSTTQLGTMFALNQSNISRRLTSAREQILQKTRQILRAQQRLSDSEFESLSEMVQSQLDLSLSRILK